MTSSARPAGGRVEERLPGLREELGASFCIVNGENAADGRRDHAQARRADTRRRRRRDHTRQPHLAPLARSARTSQTSERVIRPANFSPLAPGRGLAVAPSRDGTPVAVINVMGSLFLAPARRMFELIDGLVEEARSRRR